MCADKYSFKTTDCLLSLYQYNNLLFFEMGIDYICSHSLPDTKISKMNSAFLLGDRFQKSKERRKNEKNNVLAE